MPDCFRDETVRVFSKLAFRRVLAKRAPNRRGADPEILRGIAKTRRLSVRPDQMRLAQARHQRGRIDQRMTAATWRIVQQRHGARAGESPKPQSHRRMRHADLRGDVRGGVAVQIRAGRCDCARPLAAVSSQLEPIVRAVAGRPHDSSTERDEISWVPARKIIVWTTIEPRLFTPIRSLRQR